MTSHRIHLKGPWDYVITPTAADEPRVGTARMPQSWQAIFGEISGTAQFRRKFHRPTNLEPHERVMLVLTAVRGCGRVQLNEAPIGQFDACGELVEFDVTTLLASFNELAVEIAFDPAAHANLPGGLFGAVALDIRTAE